MVDIYITLGCVFDCIQSDGKLHCTPTLYGEEYKSYSRTCPSHTFVIFMLL